MRKYDLHSKLGSDIMFKFEQGFEKIKGKSDNNIVNNKIFLLVLQCYGYKSR
jgi:hypothetical protein